MSVWGATHLTHESFLVTLGVMEPLDGQGQDVLQGQLVARELLCWIIRIALSSQNLLIQVLRWDLSICNKIF